MRNTILIALREFIENAKTKGFWIGLLMFPFLLMASIQVPIFLEKKGTPTRDFVVIDQSGQFQSVLDDAIARSHELRVKRELAEHAGLYAKDGAPNVYSIPGNSSNAIAAIKEHLKKDAPEFEVPAPRYHQVPVPAGIDTNASLAAIAQQLKPYLKGEQRISSDGKSYQLFAAVLIPANAEKLVQRGSPLDEGGEKGAEYWSSNLADTGLRDEIDQAINAEIRRREYAANQVNPALIRRIEQTRLPLSSLNPKKAEGSEKVGRTDVIKQWAPSAFVYLLWIAIFSIVQMLLNNTIEEKSNKLIEVLLSSVTPGELMAGKLLGIAATGLSMVSAWMIALVSVLLWKASGQTGLPGELLHLVRTSNLIPAFVIYFLFGYLMYAGLILCLGSLCNTLKEAQNFMGVIVMVMMVPLLTMTFIPKDPNGTLATVLSWIPVYTPFIMLNRIAADPPLFDLIGTMLLLIATTIFVLWFSGKIFRIGILRTGQPPKFIELIRWLKN